MARQPQMGGAAAPTLLPLITYLARPNCNQMESRKLSLLFLPLIPGDLFQVETLPFFKG